MDTHAVIRRPLLPHPSEPRYATQSVAHRPWDVVEDLVSSGVPIRTSLGAKQASQLPCAVLSLWGQGRGGSQPGLRQIEGDPVTKRAMYVPCPPHLFPFSEGFLEKSPRSLLGA